MCKSLEISALTGLYSYSIAYYLYRRNLKYDRAAAIILLTFSSIQWVEALLWYDLTYVSNPMFNKFVTSLLPIVLGLEFIATLYAASMHFSISYIEMIIYAISFLALVIMWWFSINDATTIDPETGSLLWANRGITPIFRFLFLGLLLYPLLRFIPSSLTMTLIVVVTTVLFLYAFKYGETFGSNWCWIANLVALIQLYYPILGS